MAPSTTTAAATGRPYFALTLRSQNRKTGPIPVSVSGRQTCPPDCAMRPACYAAGRPLALHWQAVSDGRRGGDWRQFLAAVAALPAGQIWRHNAAGDLWRPDLAAGRQRLAALAEANRGRRGFTYSHWRPTPAVALAFRQATAQGFTVNSSCETMNAADAAVRQGVRAVVVLPSSHSLQDWRLQTPAGNPVVVCPAQRMEGMTCEKCRLCQARPADVVIGFVAHGSRKAAADRVLAALEQDAG